MPLPNLELSAQRKKRDTLHAYQPSLCSVQLLLELNGPDTLRGTRTAAECVAEAIRKCRASSA